jgi:hypothetical protein
VTSPAPQTPRRAVQARTAGVEIGWRTGVGQASARRAAWATSSRRPALPVLPTRLATCVSTVLGDMQSFSAITPLECPPATSSRTSISRLVMPSLRIWAGTCAWPRPRRGTRSPARRSTPPDGGLIALGSSPLIPIPLRALATSGWGTGIAAMRPAVYGWAALVDVSARPHLDHLAGVHDADAVGHVLHDGEVASGILMISLADFTRPLPALSTDLAPLSQTGKGTPPRNRQERSRSCRVDLLAAPGQFW